MVWETGIQSQVESYQRPKKWQDTIHYPLSSKKQWKLISSNVHKNKISFVELWILRTISFRITFPIECSPMVLETRVQSQVESYQRLKRWYVIPPCLTLIMLRYVWRIKWSNTMEGVALSYTPRCSSYWKGEPSGRPWLQSPTLLFTFIIMITIYIFNIPLHYFFAFYLNGIMYSCLIGVIFLNKFI